MKYFYKIFVSRVWSAVAFAMSMAWSTTTAVSQSDSGIRTNTSKEIMWLAKPVVASSVSFRCGNEPEFHYPRNTGIVVNEDGKILYKTTTPVLVDNISRTQVVLTHYPEYRSIPVRTIIQDSGSISFESDMVPVSIGNGWIRCTTGWKAAPRRGPMRTRLNSDGPIELGKKFYLNDRLELIEDIESYLDLDLKGHSLVGFIEPGEIPVVELPRGRGQRVILKNKELSEHVFNKIDFQRQSFNHPEFVSASESYQRWVYDPRQDKKLLKFNSSSVKNASDEVCVYLKGRGLGDFIVTDSEFNEIASISNDWQPIIVTSNNIILCSKYLNDANGEGLWDFAAFQIVVDPNENAVDRLIELDVSWIKELDQQLSGPLYAARNQKHELVVFDAALQPLVTFDSSYEVRNITEAGRVLVLNSKSQTYSLFDIEGKLVREFDVAALLTE